MTYTCDPAATPRLFPDNLVGILNDNRSCKTPRKTRFLGGRTALIGDPMADIEVFIQTEVDQAVFLEWWVTELNYGTEQFIISIPFFGIWRNWNVAVVEGSIESIPKVQHGRVRLSVRILDDLQTAIDGHVCHTCGDFSYIVDDAGNYVVDDAGNHIVIS